MKRSTIKIDNKEQQKTTNKRTNKENKREQKRTKEHNNKQRIKHTSHALRAAWLKEKDKGKTNVSHPSCILFGFPSFSFYYTAWCHLIFPLPLSSSTILALPSLSISPTSEKNANFLFLSLCYNYISIAFSVGTIGLF